MSSNQTSSTAQTRTNLQRKRRSCWIFLLPLLCMACICGLCTNCSGILGLGGGINPGQPAATSTPWTDVVKWLKVVSTDGSGSVQCHLTTNASTWSAEDQIIDLVNGTQLEVTGFGTAPVTWQNSSNNLYKVKVSQTGEVCYIRMELVTRLDTPIVPTADATQIASLHTTSMPTAFSPVVVPQSSPTPTASPTPSIRQGVVSFEDNDGVNCHLSLDSATWQTNIVKLATDDAVTIIGEAQAPVAWNGSWDLYQVTTADGQTCYLRTELVQVTP